MKGHFQEHRNWLRGDNPFLIVFSFFPFILINVSQIQLNKAVWSQWNVGDPRTDNILFAEFNSTGPGVANAARPSFATILTASEAEQYTIATAVGSDFATWVDATYLA